MKKVFAFLALALTSVSVSTQTTPFPNVKAPSKDFEQNLTQFYYKNYFTYFLNACNINKAEVSFTIYDNGKIVDVKVKSPRKDIDSFLLNGIDAVQKEWGLNEDGCSGNPKTVSFIAYFNFTVDCDEHHVRTGNYDYQKPATNYIYKEGFKIVQEDRNNIVLDKIVFHGFFDTRDSPFSKGN